MRRIQGQWEEILRRGSCIELSYQILILIYDVILIKSAVSLCYIIVYVFSFKTPDILDYRSN